MPTMTHWLPEPYVQLATMSQDSLRLDWISVVHTWTAWPKIPIASVNSTCDDELERPNMHISPMITKKVASPMITKKVPSPMITSLFSPLHSKVCRLQVLCKTKLIKCMCKPFGQNFALFLGLRLF